MSTVVTVMDREGWNAQTDNIAVVFPRRRRVVWVPRDLWCPKLGDRINAAFRLGGHGTLLAALAEHGLKVSSSLCLQRDVIAEAVADLEVFVPIAETMTFFYPLSPTKPIEEGRKQIEFSPPGETLRGERIHQWIGARYGKGRSDLDRIERQKTLLKALLDQRYDFRRLLSSPQLYSVFGSSALADCAAVRSNWDFVTVGPLRFATIDGKHVLLRAPRFEPKVAIRRIAALPRRAFRVAKRALSRIGLATRR